MEATSLTDLFANAAILTAAGPSAAKKGGRKTTARKSAVAKTTVAHAGVEGVAGIGGKIHTLVIAEYRVVKPPPEAAPEVLATPTPAAGEVQQHVILRIKHRDLSIENDLNIESSGLDRSDVPAYIQNDTFISGPMDITPMNPINKGNDKVKTVVNASDNGSGVACFWCCHTFEGDAVGLPVKVNDSKYHVCGSFCSLECATAFNFNSKELYQDVWRSYELLNKMARDLGRTGVVQPAPSRYSLKMFGGWMDIDEFRGYPKLVNPLPSPMMSIVQYMEEIMTSDIMHGTAPRQQAPSFVPLDQERVNRAKKNLMTTSVLNGKKNTIHDKMGLRARGTQQPTDLL